MEYVHGYTPCENTRLQDQASTLVELLHHDTAFLPGANVLEAGCGVGAQTVTLARKNPQAHITSIDISPASVEQTRRLVEREGLTNVRVQQGNILELDFHPETFDHVFVCFVLEHLSGPVDALQRLKRVLKPGGAITVIEGDHGSTCFYPDSPAAHKAIACQVELQKRAGGNANIGREVYPLLQKAGFDAIRVSPRMVYVDATKPHFVHGFIRKTFTAMIEGVRGPALDAGLLDAPTFDDGIRDLLRTADPDGVFCYTFFKATAVKK